MNLKQLKVRKTHFIFLMLFLFHIFMSLAMSLIVQTSAFSTYHAERGLWLFAGDSTRYHKDALRVIGFLKEGDYKKWWNEPEWWHIRLIAVTYWIFGPHPLSFAPINAIVWTLSIYMVHKIIITIFPGRIKFSLLTALLFGFFPSYLLHTTQLLREPFYILGLLMILWGWIGLLKGNKKLYLSLLVGGGIILASVNRAYIIEPLIFLSIIAFVLVLFGARKAIAFAGLALAFSGMFYIYDYQIRIKGTPQKVMEIAGPRQVKQIERMQNDIKERQRTVLKETSQPEVKEWAKYRETWLSLKGFLKNTTSWIRSRLFQIVNYRQGFSGNYPDAGINIDTEVNFNSLGDIVRYIPRAALIGFLSPFPHQWFQKATTAGPASRIVAGMEMVCWYFLLAGFIYFLFTHPLNVQIKVWLFLYCFGFVLLNTFVIPNIGAIYRVRFIYLLPVLIGGLDSITRYVNSLRSSYLPSYGKKAKGNV